MKLNLKNALPYISRNADIVRELDLSRSQIPLEEAVGLEKVTKSLSARCQHLLDSA